MTNDSRTTSVRNRERAIYVTSESPDSEWGQPAASHFHFIREGSTLRGQPIAGTYLAVTPSESFPITPELAAEFEGWEALSDEALANFEAELE